MSPSVVPADGSLQAAPRLWGAWRVIERVDDCLDFGGAPLRRVGLTAEHPDGWIATGAAASEDESAGHRAMAELVERAALMEAVGDSSRELVLRDRTGRRIGASPHDAVFPASAVPALRQPSRSNGVALGTDFADACIRAELELAERDRILRSWYGLGPAPMRVDAELATLADHRGHEWHAYRCAPALDRDSDIEVALVIGFAKASDAPLVRGSAAGADLSSAVARAAAECRQGLAFLAGEPLPDRAPPFSPTPMYHLDYYLWPGAHSALRGWLEGARPHRPRGATPNRWAPVFVDLTPAAMPGRLKVVKARCETALDLWFGQAPAELGGGCVEPHPIA